TKLADGVYAIEHADARVGFMSGNTTVIIGQRQVLVVDSGFLPSVAKEDIAQIRQWTDRPVAFLLNTHLHNDHNLGNEEYMNAFPLLTIIAHVETKKSMDMFGPGSASRERRGNEFMQEMLKTKKVEGRDLAADEETELKGIIAERLRKMDEIESVKF